MDVSCTREYGKEMFVYAAVWTSTSAFWGCEWRFGFREVVVVVVERQGFCGGNSGRGPQGGALNVIAARDHPLLGHEGRGVEA